MNFRLMICFVIMCGIAVIEAEDIGFTIITYLNKCEGKYVASYTRIQLASADSKSCQSTIKSPDTSLLIQSTKPDESAVNEVKRLTVSRYEQGGERHIYDKHCLPVNSILGSNVLEALSVVTSGPLAGKFTYYKTVFSNLDNLRKCSTFFWGLRRLEFITSTNNELLISEPLTESALKSVMTSDKPLEAFRKSSNTNCKGTEYIF